MNSPMLQLLVLAGIAIFLILRLKNVLGTRDGFEPPRSTMQSKTTQRRQEFEVIDGGPDRDILDHVEDGSQAAKALIEMKAIEPAFGVTDFLQGARGAYEMILMSFERGNLDDIMPFLSEDVFDMFSQVVDMRQEQGLTVEADFLGVRETKLEGARFDAASNTAEVTVKFIGELSSVVRNQNGDIVEGEPNKPKRQKDVWTFERVMGSNDPNWRLVATGE